MGKFGLLRLSNLSDDSCSQSASFGSRVGSLVSICGSPSSLNTIESV